MNYDIFILILLPILIIILIFILFTKFVFKKSQISEDAFNFRSTNISQKQISKDFITSKQKQIDILMRLNFICDTYFQIAQNQNTINIIYPPQNPRYFKSDALYAIIIANSLTFFLNSVFKKSYITIKFDFKNLNNNLTQCVLSVKSDKPIGNNVNFGKIQNQIIHYVPDNPIYESLEDISSYCKKLNTICEANNDRNLEFTINFKIEALSNFVKTKQDDINFDVLIASNEITFEILKQSLEFYGIKVLPNRNSDIVKKHILDNIYTPDAVFISANILIDNQEYIDILEKKSTFTKFIIILENEQDLRIMKDIKFDILYLKLPFVYETIFSLIDTILKEKSDKKMLKKA